MPGEYEPGAGRRRAFWFYMGWYCCRDSELPGGGAMVSGGGGIRVLSGLRIAVTRARGRGMELSLGLTALGASVLESPVITVVPPLDEGALIAAARQVAGYDWVVLTSATGVKYFSRAFEVAGVGVGGLDRVQVACIGPATAAELSRVGVAPALLAEEAIAESLLSGLVREITAGRGGMLSTAVGRSERVLLPVAEGARSVLERGLARIGVLVDRVIAYRTVPDEAGLAVLMSALRGGRLDLVTFASPSAFEQVANVAGEELQSLLAGVVVAVIGPITGAAVRRRGVEVQVEAAEHTAGGLLGALVEYYG